MQNIEPYRADFMPFPVLAVLLSQLALGTVVHIGYTYSGEGSRQFVYPHGIQEGQGMDTECQVCNVYCKSCTVFVSLGPLSSILAFRHSTCTGA